MVFFLHPMSCVVEMPMPMITESCDNHHLAIVLTNFFCRNETLKNHC